MRVRAVPVGGYRLRVTTWGDGAPPHAVVLPGLSADAGALAPQIRLLRRTVRTVHVIDLPGHALPPALRAADASFGSLAEMVVKTLREVGVRNAVFLGHSLGGGVALHLSLRYPHIVDALMLVAPAALGRSLHWIYKLYSLPLLGRALLRPGPTSRTFVRRWLIGSLRRDEPRFVDRLVRHGERSRKMRRAISARAVVWANQPSWWRRLLIVLVPGGEQMAFSVGNRVSELAEIPTLLLWGTEDRVICVGDAKRFREMHPTAEIHLARGAGHSVPLEAPAWTNARIAGFLERVLASRSRAA